MTSWYIIKHKTSFRYFLYYGGHYSTFAWIIVRYSTKMNYSNLFCSKLNWKIGPFILTTCCQNRCSLSCKISYHNSPHQKDYYLKIRYECVITSPSFNGRKSLIQTFTVILYLRGIWYDDVIKWKHFPHHWPFVRGIHRWPVNSPHKAQWRRALMFSMIFAWTNSWVNNRNAGGLIRRRAHFNAIVMGYV